MPIVIEDEKFTLVATGEKSKEKFSGDFRAKKCLSLVDHIDSDRMYRDILGGQNPAYANELASNIAAIVAELSVRLTKAPKWWEETRGGLLLKDVNVLKDVYEAAINIERKALEAEQKAAEQDKEVLRKNAPTDEQS